MAVQKPAIHGQDHVIGGADPIPFPDAMWPTWHLMMPWLDYDDGNYSDYNIVLDVGGSVTGAYVETTNNGDAFTWPVRLGPYGSLWGLFVVAHRGTDFGTVDYQFANANEDEHGAGLFSLDADVTFATLQARDFYRNPALKNEDFFETVFRIKGSDGDTVTAISGADPDVGGAVVFNGGAGFYLFRLHTNGKNVASSGYRVNIVSLMLRRLPAL